MCCGGGGGGSPPAPPPPAPDYTGAAIATAAGNEASARIAAKANRVSQYTPYGNLTYTNNVNGDQDQWRADMTLSPAQQKLLDQQNKISLGLGSTADRGLSYVQNMLDTPLDTSGFTKVDAPTVAGREAVTAALLERMQPGMDRSRQQRENALMIQGHNRGGEAWNALQDDLSRAENDARLGAVQAGGQEQSRLFGLQDTARRNELSETGYLRNEPLNTLNAVRTGAQVTNPTFANVPQQATTAGPDLLGAAQAQYGAGMNNYNATLNANAADAASGNAMMSGLFSLGGAALGGPMGGMIGKRIFG